MSVLCIVWYVDLARQLGGGSLQFEVLSQPRGPPYRGPQLRNDAVLVLENLPRLGGIEVIKGVVAKEFLVNRLVEDVVGDGFQRDCTQLSALDMSGR